MQVQLDRDGSLIIKLHPTETENFEQALTDFFAHENAWAKLREACDEKLKRWEDAVATNTESTILPSRFVDMSSLLGCNNPPEEPELNFQSANSWNCSICGAPNTVPFDDGCTNCGH